MIIKAWAQWAKWFIARPAISGPMESMGPISFRKAAISMVAADLSEQGMVFEQLLPSDIGIPDSWIDALLMVDEETILLVMCKDGVVTLGDILLLETTKQDVMGLGYKVAHIGNIRTAFVASAFEEDAVALAINFACSMYQL